MNLINCDEHETFSKDKTLQNFSKKFVEQYDFRID
jgi:hypothetical protein